MVSSSEGVLLDEGQLLRLLVKNVSDYAIFALDTQGRIITWNEGAERLKGYSSEEAIGRHFSVFYTKEDLAKDKPSRELRIALRRGKYEEEGWRIRKNGSSLWVHVTITPIFDDENKHIGFAKVTRDLTERQTSLKRDRLLHEIAVSASSTDSFRALLQEVVSKIGRFLNWSVGHAYIWNPGEGALSSAKTWFFRESSTDLYKFVELSESMQFQPGIGLVGMVYDRKEVILVPDVTKDKNFRRHKALGNSELRTGVGIPLIEKGQVFAVIEFFSETVIGNISQIVELGEMVSVQVSRFLERQRALEEQEAFFESSQDLLAYGTFEGKLTKINPLWESVLGYSEEEILSKPWLDFVHPDDVEATIRAGQDLIDGKPIIHENRYQRKDGTYRWLQWHSVPLVGRKIIYGIARDITKQKATEHKLQEILSLQNAVLDSSSYGIICVSLEGLVTVFNKGAEKMMGYSAEQFIGVPDPPRLTDPETLEERSADLSKFMGRPARADVETFLELARMQVPNEFEWTYIRSDGSRFPGLLTVTPLLDQNGVMTGYMGMIQDITARKEAEASQERLLRIIERSPDLISFSDTSGCLLFQNVGGNRLLGYPDDFSMVGRFGQEFVDPSSLESIRQAARPVLQTGGIWQGEATLLHKDGHKIPVSQVIFELPTREGEPRLIATIARNMSDLKETAKILEKTLALQNAILNGTSYAIISTDLSGVIQTFNVGAENLLGYSAEEAIGTIRPEVFHDPEEIVQHAKELSNEYGVTIQPGYESFTYKLLKGVSEEREWSWIRKDGSRLWVSLLTAFLRDEEGEISGFMAVAQDITARREAEVAKERLLAIIEKSPDLIGFADDKGQVVFQNAGGNRLLGYPEDHDQSKMDIHDYQPSWVFDMVDTEVIPAILESGVWQGESAVLHRDGHEIPVSQVVFPLPHKPGEPLYIATIARDISDFKKTQAQLAKQAIDLRISNQELEQFAYVASHDLQEPLRMVCSFLGLLEIEFKDQLTPDAQEYINYAVDGGMRMRGLIDGLLEFSRVGRQQINLVPLSMESVLNEALLNLQIALDEADATITHDPLPLVLGDRLSLSRLLQNLVSNSLKFRREDPVKIHIGAKLEDGEALFWIEDNGIGIDPKHEEKIFMIFQRLHAKSKYPGSGIGLSICRKIVERHGGRLWLDTEMKNGARFFFTLKSQ